MLVPCNWTAQNLRKLKWDSNFRQNHYEWAYFFEKLIDSNLLFIAVGRPNPDQCFGKSTLKSKKALTVKTGLLCNFWRCTLIVKQPLTGFHQHLSLHTNNTITTKSDVVQVSSAHIAIRRGWIQFLLTYAKKSPYIIYNIFRLVIFFFKPLFGIYFLEPKIEVVNPRSMICY